MSASAPYKVKLYVLSQTKYGGEGRRNNAWGEGGGQDEISVSGASIQHAKHK